MMNKKALSLVLGIILIASLCGLLPQYLIVKDGNITVGEVINKRKGRGGTTITVAYHYDDKKYTVKASSDEYKDMDYNQRIFVQFLPKYPSFAIITNIMVPAMIDSIPKKGWDDYPIIINENDRPSLFSF